jgi:hypothetical protein
MVPNGSKQRKNICIFYLIFLYRKHFNFKVKSHKSSVFFVFVRHSLFSVCFPVRLYDSLSVLGTLQGTILMILKTLKIKLFTHLISLNTLWDEESEIFLQIKFSSQNGMNIGIFLNIFQKYSNLRS